MGTVLVLLRQGRGRVAGQVLRLTLLYGSIPRLLRRIKLRPQLRIAMAVDSAAHLVRGAGTPGCGGGGADLVTILLLNYLGNPLLCVCYVFVHSVVIYMCLIQISILLFNLVFV